MRPKFIFALLLLLLSVGGAMLFLKQHHGGEMDMPVATANVPAALPVESNIAVTVAPPAPVALTVTNPVTPEQTQETIDAEVGSLREWSMKDDPASLSNILADLTNTNEEIREAAIDATKEFGSTNAIPALKAAADATDDIQQKIAYLEAADFLTLPGIDFSGPIVSRTPEQIQADQQRRGARETRRQAKMQSQSANPDPAPPADQNPPPNSNP